MRISIVQRFQTDGSEGMTKNSKTSLTITGGGLPPFKRDLDSSSKTVRVALDEEIKQIMSQLLLAKASELVAGLPSTREWRFIETQRLAG